MKPTQFYRYVFHNHGKEAAISLNNAEKTLQRFWTNDEEVLRCSDVGDCFHGTMVGEWRDVPIEEET